jgi:hypothetical protein
MNRLRILGIVIVAGCGGKAFVGATDGGPDSFVTVGPPDGMSFETSRFEATTEDVATEDFAEDASEDSESGTEDSDGSPPDTGLPDGFEGGFCSVDAAPGLLPPACDNCLRTTCCSTYQACEDDVLCVAVLQCIVRCVADGGTAVSCAEGCLAQTDSGAAQSQGSALLACAVSSSCSGACEVSP